MALALIAVSPSHREAIRDALAGPDPTIVPHLLEILDGDDDGLKQEVRSHLAVLLPKLTEDHRSLFDPRSRLLLTLLLEAPEDKVRKGAASAICAVGSVECLHALEKRAAKSKAEPERVRLRRALGVLRHRVAAEAIHSARQESDEEAPSQTTAV